MVRIRVECSQDVHLNKDVTLEFDNLPQEILDWLKWREPWVLAPSDFLSSVKQLAIQTFMELPMAVCNQEVTKVRIGEIELIKEEDGG